MKRRGHSYFDVDKPRIEIIPMIDIMMFLLVFFVVAIIAAAAGMAFQNRKTERIVRERLHLQAWQLRQLVA